MKVKTYEIQLGPLMGATQTELQVVDIPHTLRVKGVTSLVYSGIAGDYLQIKGEDTSIVFSCSLHEVRYCRVVEAEISPKVLPLPPVTNNVGGDNGAQKRRAPAKPRDGRLFQAGAEKEQKEKEKAD